MLFKAQPNDMSSRISTMASSDFLYLLVILITFSLVFTIQGAWLDGQVFTDEPAYLESAINHWKSGGSTSLLFSPLYNDMITPFIAIFFDKEMGFKIWKYLVFLLTSILIYYNVERLANKWVGLIMAIHFQLLSVPYISITFSTLAITWTLMCSLLLLSGRRVLGLVTGLLVLGIHIRGEFLIISALFLALSLVISPKEIFQKRFFLQLALPLAIFVAIIYSHDSTLSEYPKVLPLRGGYAVHHFIGKTMTDEGLLRKYTDQKWGNIPMDALDRAYREQFGKTVTEFREQGGFNLPEMYRANPELIERHYRRIFSESIYTIPAAFFIDFPSSSIANLRTLMSSWQAYIEFQVGIYLLFLGFALLPVLFEVRRQAFRFVYKPPPRLFYAVLVAPLGGFISWFLSMPKEHYVIMSSSFFYLGGGLLLGIIINRIQLARNVVDNSINN